MHNNPDQSGAIVSVRATEPARRRGPSNDFYIILVGMTFLMNAVGRGVTESDGYAERYELRGRGEPAMVRALLEAIRDGRPAPISAAEGRYAVELCWGGAIGTTPSSASPSTTAAATAVMLTSGTRSKPPPPALAA